MEQALVSKVDGGRTIAQVDESGNGVVRTFDAQGEPTWASVGLLGDLNVDGRVDFADFVIFAKEFGKER